MFPISPTFQRILETRIGRNRFVSWWGTITLTNGTKYNFTADEIAQGSGSLVSSCDIPGVGGAFSTEFQARFFLAVDPRTLFNAEIGLFVRLSCVATAGIWDEAKSFYWSEINSTTWGDTDRTIYTDVPLGLFLITDAKRAINSIQITAYDYMAKFDRALPSMDTVARIPFDWMRWLCKECGVELGMTNTEVKALLNGGRSFTYADVDSGVKKCRDLLSNLAAALGCIAVIDRYGKLKLVQHSTTSVMEITPDGRFSSTFSDVRYRYTGLSAQYRAKAINEYFKNVGTLDDNGLIIELGTNVFLQISNDSNRALAIQSIIDGFHNIYFTPFEVSVPFDPSLDLLDVVTFTGGHAPTNCYGPITSLVRRIDGTMTIKCEVPDEEENPVRETTQAEGLSGAGAGTVYASSDFWIVINSFPESATIIGDDTLTNELTVNCTVENTCTQIAWTGTYTIDEDASVTVKILVDDEVIYQVSDDQKAGTHTLNVTTGYDITEKGEHTVKVIMREDVL